MTLDQLKAFLSKVKGDATLQEKLNNARSPDDIVSICLLYTSDAADDC